MLREGYRRFFEKHPAARITGGTSNVKNMEDRINGAGNGARTRGIKLGKLALYQLSYARTDYNFRRKGKRKQEKEEIGNRYWVMGKEGLVPPMTYYP